MLPTTHMLTRGFMNTPTATATVLPAPTALAAGISLALFYPTPIVIPIPPERQYGCTRLCAVEYGGADPTGKVEATACFQKAVDALPLDLGGEVHVPEGTYLVDPTVGIAMRSNMHFHMDPKAVIMAKTNDAIRYGILKVNNVTQVLVTLGTLVGDREHHIFTLQKTASENTHEWGHGIQCYGASAITFRGGVIKDCCGDGASLSELDVHNPSNDIYFDNVISTNNRRQGISVGKSTNVIIRGGELAYTNGTAPECGIDIEPENGGSAENIYLDGVHMHHNTANGFLALQRKNVDSPVKNIFVHNCISEYNGACGIYAASVQGIDVHNNKLWHNGQTGFNVSAGCTGVHISENTFGYNYNRGGPGKARTPFAMFGVNKTVDMDILTYNTDPNAIGRNYYI